MIITVSAVQIFEISNRIVTSVFETTTIIRYTQGSSRMMSQ